MVLIFRRWQGAHGGGVNFLQGNIPVDGETLAGGKFRSGLDDFAVQFPNLDGDIAERCCHGLEFPLELPTFRDGAADAKGAGLAQNHFTEFIGITGGAKNGEQNGWPIFLHLNRRMEDVERTGAQGQFRKITEHLGIDVVQIGFQHTDGVDFPIVGGVGGVVSQDGAEHIGPGFVVAGAEAETHAGGDEIAHRAKIFDQFGKQGGAGGGNEFAGFLALGDGDAARAEDGERGGRRNWEPAMSTLDPAGAFDHRAGKNTGLAEEFQTDASADNIHNGIDCADFMKVDVFRRHPMDLPFGDRNAVKDRKGFLLHPGRERALPDQGFDLGEIPAVLVIVSGFVFVGMSPMFMRMGMRRAIRVGVLVRGRRFVRMHMGMGVRFVFVGMGVPGAIGVSMFVFVAVIGGGGFVMVFLVFVSVGVLVRQMDIKFDAFDLGFMAARPMQVIAFKTQFSELTLELMEINPEVEQRADQHIAADSAENIEIKCFHKLYRYPIQGSRRSIRRSGPLPCKKRSQFAIAKGIDLAGGVGGAKAVVDVHHSDTTAATIEHAQQRGQPAEICAIAHAGGDGDDRLGNEARDHARQRAFHSGHDHNHVGLLDGFETTEQSMQPGDPNVINPLHIVAHDFRSDDGFFGHGQIAGSGAKDGNGAGSLGLKCFLDCNATGNFVMNGVGEFAFQGAGVLGFDARDKEALLAFINLRRDESDLFRCFAGAEDDFGKPFAKRAMHVHLGETEIGHRRCLEGVQHFFPGDFSRAKLFQELGGIVCRHRGIMPWSGKASRWKIRKGSGMGEAGQAEPACFPPGACIMARYGFMHLMTHFVRWLACLGAIISIAPATALAQAPVVVATNRTIRVLASNLSSGNNQRYETPGLNILKGLKPDVVAMQEFNYASTSGNGVNTAAAIREMVDDAFGTNFFYVRETGKSIPNGVISRFPILASGVWDDPQLTDRDFIWAQLDLPGTNDLYVVSVHLHSSGGSSSRSIEATVLTNMIQTTFPANAFIVLAGDLNTDSRSEAALSKLTSLLSDAPIPTDAVSGGDPDTNQGRSKPYEYVLPSYSLASNRVATVIGSRTFPNGLVFDSRVYTPLSEVSPVQQTDSSAFQMQHMGVVKDFRIDYTVTNFVTVPPPMLVLNSTNVLRWQGLSNVTYSVQASTNLPAFSTIGTASSPTTQLTFTNQTGGDQRFSASFTPNLPQRCRLARRLRLSGTPITA